MGRNVRSFFAANSESRFERNTQMMERMLLVDDEPTVLSGLERTLHNEFEVTTAPNGEAGLAAMHEQAPFAVVISDMRMPGMNGAQFLTKMKALAPDTVRMLLTG
jgi:DNA-binding NtrC family response regulator